MITILTGEESGYISYRGQMYLCSCDERIAPSWGKREKERVDSCWDFKVMLG